METSDIQRRAYNQAMAEAGLAWVWSRATYANLLEQSGGKDRLAMLAAATGHDLAQNAIDAIHARKTEIACAEIIASKVPPRRGVVELARVAKSRGLRLGFVTTTYRPNIDAIFEALKGVLPPELFAHIGDRVAVEIGKPAPDAYRHTLHVLGVHPDDALAIEDTALSVMSAKRAGIRTVATPGELSAGQDFWQADLMVDDLLCGNGIDPHVLAMLD